MLLDEEANALGEAERLARAGAGEDEQRAGSASMAARCDGEAMSGGFSGEPIAVTHVGRRSTRTVRVVGSRSRSTSSPAASCLNAGLSMK